MPFQKKHFWNILFVTVLVLLLIPRTRMAIQVRLQRLLAGAPSTIAPEKRTTLTDFNWPLQQLDGQAVNLSDAKGQVIVVNQWATWCPPCVAEMPSLQKLYDDYGKRVRFFCISNEDIEKLQQFMQQKKYTLPVLMERQAPPALLQTRSLPATWVISKTGQVVMYETGAANWNSDHVRRLLDELLLEPPVAP